MGSFLVAGGLVLSYLCFGTSALDFCCESSLSSISTGFAFPSCSFVTSEVLQTPAATLTLVSSCTPCVSSILKVPSSLSCSFSLLSEMPVSVSFVSVFVEPNISVVTSLLSLVKDVS